jgi:sulfoxide reductase heme-binding subunit YedZ
MVDPSRHLFWITSNAAGTTALLLSSATVGYGLMMAARAKGQPGATTTRRTIHEALSLGVMVALAVHGLALLGDGFLRQSLLDVSVPFVSGYRTGWTTLGIVSAWAIVALGLSFYARERIGRERFKLIHRFTLVAWLGGIVHSLGEGSDAGQVWFLALVGLSLAPAAVALALRAAKALAARGHASAPAVAHVENGIARANERAVDAYRALQAALD